MSGARVASLRRYPVKSMDGEDLATASVTPAGIPGDRGWRLIERSTGRPASAKRHAALMMCRARYLDEPMPGKTLPPAEVVLPDETKIRTDDPGAAKLFSKLLRTDVEFVSATHGAFDAKPLHLISTATLNSLAEETRLDFDLRRFRPNILVGTNEHKRTEDSWVGRTIRIGTIQVSVVKTVKRCVMTTLPQPTLPAAKAIFDAVSADGGALGVYGEALGSGAWRVGDPVIPGV